MEKIKLFIVVVLLSLSNIATAQYANSKSIQTPSKNGYTTIGSGKAYRSKSLYAKENCDNYGRLTVSSIFSVPSFDDEETFYGAGVGYLFGINLTQKAIPFFLEIGPEINYMYAKYDKEKYSEENSFHLLSLNTPLNITYKFDLGHNVAFAPFLGASARLNLMALDIYDNHYHHKETYDMFDSDDFEPTAYRFQFGLNVGFGFYIHRFYIGYRYNRDLTPFRKLKESRKDDYEELKFDHHYISLGVYF